MRWLWIDKFVEFVPGQRAVATKNVSLAEEHLHDLYPDFPIVPHSLVIEGFAQTAGILVGQTRQFAEKVILAKISRATFHRLARPGDTLSFHAAIRQLSEQGATCGGVVKIGDQPLADVELMFSHVDQNLAGMRFPSHNFVFDGAMLQLVQSRSSADIPLIPTKPA
jgi:3-hydroxyacyl-[acyl-carrier-protein] dehydratase